MPPPPAEPFAARVFLGPALRAQPDRRLVKLVREGYEAAFEEIVRRYRKPLDRFAAAIVGGRSEDVTQDAFSKALMALRGTTAEIELKPWLYRIVRNTALNEIRDAPPATEELGEATPGAHSAAVEAERREEINELMERLRALPEPQRAAIVMRELEGLSHEEIAAALGVSGGAARQAIYRARLALRDGLGLLVPLPLLRMLFDHGAEAASAGAGVAAAGAASAAGGGAAMGGLGAAGALKVGLATVVLAGSVGAGVAVQQERGSRGPDPAEAAVTRTTSGDDSFTSLDSGSGESDGAGHSSDSGEGGGDDSERGSGDGKDRGGDDSGHRGESKSGDDDSPGRGAVAPEDSSGHGGSHPSDRGHSGADEDFGEDHSGGSHSGRHGGESGGRGPGGGGPGGHGSSGGSGSSGGPEPEPAPDPAAAAPPAPEPAPVDSDDDGSGSGDSGSGGSGSGGDS